MRSANKEDDAAHLNKPCVHPSDCELEGRNKVKNAEAKKQNRDDALRGACFVGTRIQGSAESRNIISLDINDHLIILM